MGRENTRMPLANFAQNLMELCYAIRSLASWPFHLEMTISADCWEGAFELQLPPLQNIDSWYLYFGYVPAFVLVTAPPGCIADQSAPADFASQEIVVIVLGHDLVVISLSRHVNPAQQTPGAPSCAGSSHDFRSGTGC